jgi:type IV fimbrial biogenesis protein FimT
MEIPNHRCKKVKGFTLIELMVTITLLAVLMAIAVPSFQRLIASQRLTAATNELYISLLQARSDAMRQGKRMTVCRSSNGTSCTTTAGTWTAGWMTFVDPTRASASPSVDANETITFVVQGVNQSLIINGNMSYVSFNAEGQSVPLPGSVFNNGTMRVCNTSPALTDDTRARDLRFTPSGRIVIEKVLGISDTCPSP